MITLECERLTSSPDEAVYHLRLFRSTAGKMTSMVIEGERQYYAPPVQLDTCQVMQDFLQQMPSRGIPLIDRVDNDSDTADAARYRWLKERNAAALACVAWRVPTAAEAFMDVGAKTPDSSTIDNIVDTARGVKP